MKFFNPLRCLPIVALILVTACASNPPPMAVKQQLDLLSRINFNVLTVAVLDRSPSPTTDSPYNINNFQPTIANALRQALTQKMVAVGTTGEMIVVIKDASLKSEIIPHKEDGWWDRPQASKYVAHAEIEIHVRGREGEGQVLAQASRFVTLPLNPTNQERQDAYNTVLNGIFHDLGIDLSGAIQEHIQRFIVNAPMMDSGGR